MEDKKEITNETKEKKPFKKTPVWKIMLIFILVFGTIGTGIFFTIKKGIEQYYHIKYISIEETQTHIILNIEINDFKEATAIIKPEDFSAKEQNTPYQAKYFINSEKEKTYQETINVETIISIYFEKENFNDINSIKFYFKGKELIFGKNIKIKY